ncbi:MAG: hypothetical protein ACJ762_20340 [Solirubrobacteraceae bacterium]
MTDLMALPDLLRTAGANMTHRGGRAVPADYGSAAGELAVCMRGVGLATRADLATLSLRGKARGLDQLLQRFLGHPVATGGAVLEAGAWWSRPFDEEVLVVCRYDRAKRLRVALAQEVSRFTAATLIDQGEDRALLEIAGRHTGRVLATLGLGSATSPVIAALNAVWILQSDTSALAIVPAVEAAGLWKTLDAAGHPHGISCVGIDALERYTLVERAAGHRTLL